MKNFYLFPLYACVAGIILLIVGSYFGWLDIVAFKTFGLLFFGFTSAAVAIALLKNASALLLFSGVLSSVSGLILWSMACFHIIEMKTFWSLSFLLISFGLLCGIYSRLNFNPTTKKIALSCMVLFFIIEVALLLFGNGNDIFLSIGSLLLLIISIFAILGSILKPGKVSR